MKYDKMSVTFRKRKIDVKVAAPKVKTTKTKWAFEILRFSEISPENQTTVSALFERIKQRQSILVNVRLCD